MSWFKNQKELGFFLKFCFKVLRSGNIPQHVAIIMDGNRRFAKKHGLQKSEGHSKGFEKLAEVLYWCFELGIPEVTVYAFSTENFKRSQEEVAGLMSLAKEKFDKLMEEKDKIEEHQVSVRIIGDVSLLPEDLRCSIARVVDFSKNYSRSVLNVAIAYSSRHEITEVIKEISIGVKEGHLRRSDINEMMIEQCLYSNKARDVDLVIRTSGEVRLSDFLMWQSGYSMLSFVDQLWPEFTVWQFAQCILSYQLGYSILQDTQINMKMKQKQDVRENDTLQAQQKLLEQLRNSECLPESIKNLLDQETEICRTDRESRVANFLRHLDRKRNSFIPEAKLANV